MNWFEGKKVVVPIDFGEESQGAVDTALKLVSPSKDVFIIYVAPDLEVSAPEVVWQALTDDVRRSNIEESFQKQFAGEKYRKLPFRVEFGDPGHRIADYAAEVGADLIVMPSHGRSGLKRLMLGSVAERVLRLAQCPVLVLKQKS